MDKIFFSSWDSIIRTVIITALAYVILIFMLRVSGKRTLSQMNAFDFIVTIALGSTFATVALNKNIALADGATALFLLIFMQFIVTWLSVRFKWIKRAMTSEPAMLLYKGELFRDVLTKERVTIEEINFAVRKSGIGSLDQVEVIILETTGKLTVIKSLQNENTETLKDVVTPNHVKI